MPLHTPCSVGTAEEGHHRRARTILVALLWHEDSSAFSLIIGMHQFVATCWSEASQQGSLQGDKGHPCRHQRRGGNETVQRPSPRTAQSDPGRIWSRNLLRWLHPRLQKKFRVAGLGFGQSLSGIFRVSNLWAWALGAGGDSRA